jgi:hypothetical protein
MGRMTREMAITRTNFLFLGSEAPRTRRHSPIPYAELGSANSWTSIGTHARLADVIKLLAWANP